MYREIFSKHFPSPAAASTVPHVSISHASIPEEGDLGFFKQMDWTKTRNLGLWSWIKY
jgi:hypothetical protein